jgi:hypothetical protein
MYCTQVRSGKFLLVLSLALVSTRAWSGDPPRKSSRIDPSETLGDGQAIPDLRAQQHHKVVSGVRMPPARDKPLMPVTPLDNKPKSWRGAKLHGGEKAIMKALKENASLEFIETPLTDVVDYLSEKYRIPIRLDKLGLRDAKICEDAPVTCRLSGISLQSALEIVLDELQLKWTIQHDVLTITSPQKAESDEFMCTKLYDVADLVTPAGDSSIDYNPLTEPSSVVSDPTSYTMSPPIASPQGYTGPVTEFHFPHATDSYVQRSSIGSCRPIVASQGMDFKPLIDAITNTTQTKSWVDNGGTGTIAEIPSGYLVVNQTGDVQRQIERFLAELRARQQAVPTFQIELYWLWLDAAHRDTLFASDRKRSAIPDLRAIDPQRLSQVAREVPSLHAHATCMNSLSTVLAAGDRRTFIVNAVPVSDNSIGYSPVVSMPNVGVGAAIRPTLLHDKKSAILCVHADITRWTPGRPPAIISAARSPRHGNVDASRSAANVPVPGGPKDTHSISSDSATTSRASTPSHGGGSGSCPVDLPVMPTQQFGTAVRVPLGKPVVIGSVTFAPAGDAGLGEAKENPVDVYLIATTSVVKNAAKQ